MNLNNLNLLKARFGNNRNMDDLIDTLAAINKPPLSIIQSGIPLGSSYQVVAVAHALGAVPSNFSVGIQVLPGQTDLSWTAGTVIKSGQVWTDIAELYIPAISGTADATNVYVIQVVAGASMLIYSNTNPPSLLAINPVKWAFTVYASLDYIVPQPTDPYIVLQPANQAVTAPAALNFIISATGTATLVYQWQVSVDTGLTWSAASGGVYSGNTTNTLAISNSTGLNGYQYRCVVTNGLSNSVVTNVVTLTVS